MKSFIDWMHEIFPNYTEAMYLGNEPAGKMHAHLNGGYTDRWECKYGGGETYHDEIIHASFSLNHKVTIYIVGDKLWVVDIRYSGKSDFWEHCVNHSGMPGYPCCREYSRHKMEPERLGEYLNAEIPNCKFWDIVQSRAKELCGMTGNYLAEISKR